MVATRKVIIGVGVLVVIGAIVGIIVAVTGGSDDSDANTSSGETTSSSSGSGTGTSSSKKSSNVTESDLLTNSTASGSGSGNKEPDSDPEEAKAALTMLAIEVAEKYVEHAWIAAGNPYGFFMLHFSEDWLKTEFVTFDDSWTFSVKKDEIVKGGYQKGHCWHVPVTVGAGKECASSKSAV
ncbi:hypothetical protein PC129_g755 [Phytophthora cactorum]|uniref:Uncharacterized protein n=1 Tax=Phytophthora cactorum TaxID=29920 RepID=A0A8T1IY96_9STRA|nr:hypothetical protein PC128_g45 [Phytophthora cactorum]KAG3228728.1 hypothetical protein PC129_g755 [Phytophthora cactorum]KAG4064038.1 hypothetical protein PC123_g1157 [Phytophthora cactorum]